MKSRLLNLAAVISATLLVLVVVVGAASYWRGGYFGHRDTTWSPGLLSNRNATFAIGHGRGAVIWSRYTMDMSLFLPEKWSTLAPDAQQRLLGFKANWAEFHGWDCQIENGSPPPLGETLYDSALGLTWDHLATPGPGHGTILCIPLWLIAALLAILPAHSLRRRRASSRLPNHPAPLRPHPLPT